MRVATVALLVVAALAFPGLASAKSYRLTNADETFQIQGDGSVRVSERLTFSFSGTFHGAYRLIPDDRRPVDQRRLGQRGRDELRARCERGDWIERRSWDVRSRADAGRVDAGRLALRGGRHAPHVHRLLRAAPVRRGVLGRRRPLPPGVGEPVACRARPSARDDRASRAGHDAGEECVPRVGHPASVKGSVKLASAGTVTVDATGIPPTQFVEADVAFPARLVTGADVVQHAGAGLDAIVAREKQIFSSPYGNAPTPVGSTSGGGGIFHWISTTSSSSSSRRSSLVASSASSEARAAAPAASAVHSAGVAGAEEAEEEAAPGDGRIRSWRRAAAATPITSHATTTRTQRCGRRGRLRARAPPARRAARHRRAAASRGGTSSRRARARRGRGGARRAGRPAQRSRSLNGVDHDDHDQERLCPVHGP